MSTLVFLIYPVLRAVNTLLCCHKAALLRLDPKTYEVVVNRRLCTHLQEYAALVSHVTCSEVKLDSKALRWCIVRVSIIVDSHLCAIKHAETS